MGVACQLDLLGHYYEIGKIVHSDTIIFKMSNLNQKSTHKLDAKGMNFKKRVCKSGRSKTVNVDGFRN